MAAHRHRQRADDRLDGAGSAVPGAHRSRDPRAGASGPQADIDRDETEKKFTLRLPASLLAEIERDAKCRPDRISINSWLIGAALQRLEKRHDNGEMAA